MPRHIAEKCRLCAKLGVEEAKRVHGPNGDGCWEGQRCHQRRSHYRNQSRTNTERKRTRLAQQGVTEINVPRQKEPTAKAEAEQAIPVPLPPPQTYAGYVLWYRERKDAPLHALGAELWFAGKRIAVVPAVHTLGATEGDVRQLLKHILEKFTGIAGRPLHQFRGAVELHPHQCPIRPCPLHPEPIADEDEKALIHL